MPEQCRPLSVWQWPVMASRAVVHPVRAVRRARQVAQALAHAVPVCRCLFFYADVGRPEAPTALFVRS